MSVIEGQNDLDFVIPSQVEENDLANQLENNTVQVYQADTNGTEEYDELRDVINDDEAIWNAPTTSPVATGQTASVVKTNQKTVYTTTVVEQVPVSATHIVSLPARQPAKKRKAARPTYVGDRKGNRGSQELSFSCDQCSLTFRDPQQAVKHISERHMAQMPSNEGHLDDLELHESQVLNSALSNIVSGNRIVTTANGEDVLLQMEEMPHSRAITVSEDQLNQIRYETEIIPVAPSPRGPSNSSQMTKITTKNDYNSRALSQVVFRFRN